MTTDPHPTARALREMARQRGVLPQNGTTTPSKPAPRPWAPYRSKWEAEYARYLDVLKATNRIWEWAYEPESLVIGIGAKYTPDFRVMPTWGGSSEFHEVKGYKREAAMVRIKAAALRYPDRRFVLVTKANGQWVHTPVAHRAPRPGAGG